MKEPVPAEWLEPHHSNGDTFITYLLSDVEPVEVTWVWQNRIPLGKLTIIQGDPGKGKTWLVLDIIQHITNGTPFCDGSLCNTAHVLFVTAEDGIADTIRPRLDLLCANATKVHWLDVVQTGGREVGLDLDKHYQLLDSWLASHPQVGMVALDPLAAFLGKIDSHRNSDVRGVLGRLGKLAEKHSVAIVGIQHLTKGLAKAIHRSIGSIAFVAAARAVWQVMSDPDDPDRRLFLPVKMNLAKANGLAFRITDKGITWESGTVDISPDEAEVEDDETPRQEAKDWLRTVLKPGPCAAQDVERQAKQDGISMRTLKRAKKELGVVSLQSKGGWSWAFPSKTEGTNRKRRRRHNAK